MWLFRIFLGYLFAKYMGFGVIGTWLAMFVDWIFRGALFIWRWKSGKWQSKFVR